MVQFYVMRIRLAKLTRISTGICQHQRHGCILFMFVYRREL